MVRQKVTPFLWFDTQAEEAANFYVSLFPGSRITHITRCGPAGPGPAGSAMVVEFELAGSQFLALNGGPHYRLTAAFSLSVDCADQAEIDRLWEQLTQGGSPGPCGWLTDRFGLSWQIVPSVLPRLLADPVTAGRVLPVMMQMTRLEIAPLEAAARG